MESFVWGIFGGIIGIVIGFVAAVVIFCRPGGSEDDSE